MSWDVRSERIAARASAAKAAAEAEALRTQTAIERERARAELDDQRGDKRRARRAETRAALAKAVRERAGLVLPVVAVGSPAVLAWRGQGQFADAQMHLGLLSPLLPIAIEGSVLYCAYLAHQAVAAALPATRYRVLSWLLAFMAAGMNLWHGRAASGLQVGVALAATSLLSIVLLELTIGLRKARQEQQSTGRTAAEVRRALIRRVRYPRLSLSADALAAARDLDAGQAWRAAWVERYGLGPEATRRDRRIARRILRYDQRAAKQMARDMQLTIVDGQLVPIVWFNDNDPDKQPAAPDAHGEAQPLVDSSAWDEVINLNVQERAPGMIADIERYLTEQAERTGGPLLEMPSGGDERRAPQREERPDRPGEEHSGEHGEERPEGRGKRRSSRRSKSGRRAARRAPQGQFEERLATTRRLMDEHDNRLSSTQLASELGIGQSTARKLLRTVRIERGLAIPTQRENGDTP